MLQFVRSSFCHRFQTIYKFSSLFFILDLYICLSPSSFYLDKRQFITCIRDFTFKTPPPLPSLLLLFLSSLVLCDKTSDSYFTSTNYRSNEGMTHIDNTTPTWDFSVKTTRTIKVVSHFGKGGRGNEFPLAIKSTTCKVT